MFLMGVGAGSPAVSTTFPSFVNNGAILDASSVHTANLTASRVNGNLLVLYFKSIDPAHDPTVSAGWTQLDTFGYGSASQRFGVYYCYVTGSETAPQITQSANSTKIVSLVVQYT